VSMILDGMLRFALVAMFVVGMVTLAWPAGEPGSHRVVRTLLWAATTLALSVLVLFVA
jgi:hypothetical protein